MRNNKVMSCIIAMMLCMFATSCVQKTKTNNYLDFKTPGAYQAAGIQMIKLNEGYKVWTKRYGNSPMKVLILHGGPGGTHEYMECFQSFFPKANIEFYEYDQLGSGRSDNPDDDSLWTLDRFVEEVETVRKYLGLNKDNFFLLGQSWGGILAMEYANKYQQNLKGLIICNMTASFDSYGKYNQKLRAQLRPTLLDTLKRFEEKGEYNDPLYQELVYKEFYTKHVCRLPQWPEPVVRGFSNINAHVYTLMQGPSEFLPGGLLKNWSMWERLPKVNVPTLSVGAKYDTMNPEDMRKISTTVPNGRFLYCPKGSHLAMWDDQEVFMNGIVKFINDVDQNKFQKD